MTVGTKRSIGIILVLLGVLFSAAAWAVVQAPASAPRRIISLSPNTTEILFALGLGDRVVGVTRYCDYPREARTKTEVGGFLDPNYEEIVALKPDLVILLTSHRDTQREMDKMGIQTLVVPHETISDIHESIQRIGKACGAEEKADAMVKHLRDRMERVRKAVQGEPRPRVLICIGRDTNSGKLAGMYMAGRDNFYDEIIMAAGGINAYTDKVVAYPQISAEGVIELNPDLIIDLVHRIKKDGKTPADITGQWDRLKPVTAVQKDQVYVIVGGHALRPGPRYIQFLEQLTRLLHPGVLSEKAIHD